MVRENGTAPAPPKARSEGESIVQRRSFLLAGSGLTLIAVSACTSPQPSPAPTPPITPTPSPSPALPVPAPERMRRSSWSEDPYALGAFSFIGVGSNPEHRATLARPVSGRLFFAGEATSVNLPGTVAGALQSGLRAADEVLAIAQPGERIAIVGAGIAGATVARQLTDAGFDVTVLEARERTGGRIETVTADGWDIPIEMGAGLIDSESAPVLLSRLEEHGVLTLALEDTRSVRTARGLEIAPSTLGADAIGAAIDIANERPGDVTIGTALEQTPPADEPALEGGLTPADWVETHLRNDIEIRYGAGSELSSRYGLDDGPRTADRIVAGGFAKLVDDALEGIDVWTTNVVSRIEYADEGVNLRFATGESLRADRVVVTVPVGVLKSRDITFEPTLPLGHIVATMGLRMGSADKIWLQFATPFWSTDAVHWSVAGGDLEITEWINLEPATGSAILVGLVGGDRADALAALDDDEIIAAARRSLRPFLT